MSQSRSSKLGFGRLLGSEQVRILAPLFILCAFIVFYHLGGAALFEPDEGRNADKARDLLLLKDWVTPYTNFVPALDKPIFFYWMIAIAYKLFGISEFTARLPSALSGLACVALVVFFGRRFFGLREGIWSGLVLISSVEYFLLARIVIFDMALTLAVTLSLCAFCWAAESESSGRKKLFYLLMYVGAAVGTLIKGPIGFILPGMVVVAYIAATRKWRLLGEMRLLSGTLLFLLITAPWYIWCEVRNPGYLRYFLWEENFVRYFTPHFNRPGPWYYFLVVLLVGFIPWTLMIPFVLREANWRDNKTLFLLLWAGLPFVFFSLSSSKLPHYILPIYPPLALLTGRTIVKILDERSQARSWMLSLPWITVMVPLALWMVLFYWPGLVPARGRPSFEYVSRTMPADYIVVLLLALIAVAWGSAKGWWVRWVFPVSCLALLLFLCLMAQTMERVSGLRSSKELAQEAAGRVRPGEQVVFYDTYPSSLPFYLDFRSPAWIVWSGSKKSLMGSFYITEKNPQPAAGYGKVLFTFDQFAQLWKTGNRPLLVFVKKKDLPKLIQETRSSPEKQLDFADFDLVSNRSIH
ncbi:MAG TPA: glycosyltransferase family 39 protein [Terriglobales bacterium]|nr:glycosyltransferase family 39 protein [Terriglobales bacterium]